MPLLMAVALDRRRGADEARLKLGSLQTARLPAVALDGVAVPQRRRGSAANTPADYCMSITVPCSAVRRVRVIPSVLTDA